LQSHLIAQKRPRNGALRRCQSLRLHNRLTRLCRRSFAHYRGLPVGRFVNGAVITNLRREAGRGFGAIGQDCRVRLRSNGADAFPPNTRHALTLFPLDTVMSSVILVYASLFYPFGTVLRCPSVHNLSFACLLLWAVLQAMRGWPGPSPS